MTWSGNECLLHLGMSAAPVIRYRPPQSWLRYDFVRVQGPLTEARAAILALTQMPYQRSWAEKLQAIQLKREVAGTSRIEGAEFTERELDVALTAAPEALETRSQRQAAAALVTYRWIADLPDGRPVDEELIRDIHRRVVTGCDDDHCPPGQLRGQDQNVTFGAPRHRGVEGGEPCAEALRNLVRALGAEFREHDPLIQALALHYHFAAMHPFLDGNGRTARALEALMLQRLGLRDTLFIAMSNYYYEEKIGYLTALCDTRASEHDLTPFLAFALRGIELQCKRLLREIRVQVEKALYRNTVTDLFGRLRSPRKRVVSERHVRILNLFLEYGHLSLPEVVQLTASFYTVRNPKKALVRDLSYLMELGALRGEPSAEVSVGYVFQVNLAWPAQITEGEFMRKIAELPKSKVHSFLSR